jgi:hypothetical protein
MTITEKDLVYVDEHGKGTFNYELLEQVTSQNLVRELRNIEKRNNFFNVKIRFLKGTERIHIAFIRVPSIYDDLEKALSHNNGELIQLTSFENGEYFKDELFLFVLGDVGLNVSLKK